MNTLGNLLWLIFGGLLMAALYFIFGLILCITIIGIPFGMQIFKIAGLALFPFGKDVVSGPQQSGCLSVVMNIIWIVCGGIELAITHLVLGIIFCITIIGIPFGKQHFKMMTLALAPFGKEIVSI